MINQAPIVRYRASVCEIFFSDFRKKTFSAESIFTFSNSNDLTDVGNGKFKNSNAFFITRQ